MLISKFEDLKMMEHKTINDFNSKLCDIANEAFAFGKKIFRHKTCEKTLRSQLKCLLTKSLPLKKFKM